MLHKNVIEKRTGFRSLNTGELEAVSGGEIIVTAPRPDPWRISVTPGDLAMLGIFNFGHNDGFPGIPTIFPSGGDGGGNDDDDGDSWWDQIKEWFNDLISPDCPEEDKEFMLPITEDGLGEILRNCLDAGGFWEITGSNVEGAVGYKMISANGDVGYFYMVCHEPEN